MSQMGMMPNMMGVDPNMAAGASNTQGNPADFSLGMNMGMFPGMYQGMMNPNQPGQGPSNQ